MPPPMRSLSAFCSRLRMTPILSEILAPPRMATKGRSGDVSRRPRNCNSFSMRKPATAGRYWATPTTDAWARCALPNASLTKSPSGPASAANCRANSGSFLRSPGWKRVFSSSITSPGFNSRAIASARGPTVSGQNLTGWPSRVARCSATGWREYFGSGLPLGRPRWDMRMTAAP